MNTNETMAGLLKKVHDAMPATYGVNATYKHIPDSREFDRQPLVQAVLHGIATGQPYLIVGDSGIGKTSFLKWVLSMLGIQMVYIPAANVSVENLMVPFPIDDSDTGEAVLEMRFYAQLMTPDPKVIVIDELGRAEPDLGNTIMELIQERSLAGVEVPGLQTVIGLDNLADGTYGRLNTLDFAQADRVATVVMDHNGTPWPRALAAKYDTYDLTSVFDTYARQPLEIRRTLSPRVLDHMIYALLNGFPGETALPIIMGERVKLQTEAGIDRTDEIIDAVAAGLQVASRPNVHGIFDKALAAALNDGVNVYFESIPGFGKTQHITSWLGAQGAELDYFSAPVLTPEDLHVPFPSADGKSLELRPLRQLMAQKHPGAPKVIVLDEVYRASRRTSNALMEVQQERTIGGRTIPGLRAVIGINNPKSAGGMKLNVGRSDMAQATRWTLSIQLSPSDTGWSAWLYATYGEEITPFLEWWQDDLDDTARVLITARGIERLFGLYSAGLPLEWGKPYVNGEHVPVPLIELENRLARNPVARFQQIVTRLEEYEAKLREPDPVEVNLNVFYALSKAELLQLERNRDACVRLMALMAQQHKISLLRAGGARQEFWMRVLHDAQELQKSRESSEATGSTRGTRARRSPRAGA